MDQVTLKKALEGVSPAPFKSQVAIRGGWIVLTRRNDTAAYWMALAHFRAMDDRTWAYFVSTCREPNRIVENAATTPVLRAFVFQTTCKPFYVRQGLNDQEEEVLAGGDCLQELLEVLISVRNYYSYSDADTFDRTFTIEDLHTEDPTSPI